MSKVDGFWLVVVVRQIFSKEFSDCCLQGALARWLAAWNLVRVWLEYVFFLRLCQVSKSIMRTDESVSQLVSGLVSKGRYISACSKLKQYSKTLLQFLNSSYSRILFYTTVNSIKAYRHFKPHTALVSHSKLVSGFQAYFIAGISGRGL